MPPSPDPGPRPTAPPARSARYDGVEAPSGRAGPTPPPSRAAMSEVRLIPLGVGEAFTARHYTTCLALGVDDRWLLIECPHPIRKMLREATGAAGWPLDLDRIEAVAVTHLHADHCSGLEDYGYYSWYALGRRARIAM